MSTASWLIAAGILIFAYMLAEPFFIRLRHIDISFANLPEAFDGCRLLHLSDLHISKFGYLERLTCRIVSDNSCDYCFVTGDIAMKPTSARTFHKLVSCIGSNVPVFACPGNTEHKPWVNTGELLAEIAQAPVRLLVNSSVHIERDGQAITVVGVDDPYSHNENTEAAFAGVNPRGFVIFLTHCPSTTPEGISRGADLILAGHTHGGQVRFPFTKWFWTHMNRNTALNDGLYDSECLAKVAGIGKNGSQLFVSRGVGTSKIHLRFFCPPEIAIITLHRT